jgi:hypothetical protein
MITIINFNSAKVMRDKYALKLIFTTHVQFFGEKQEKTCPAGTVTVKNPAGKLLPAFFYGFLPKKVMYLTDFCQKRGVDG